MFKLRYNPVNPMLQTYELTAPFFKPHTPEHWLLTKYFSWKIFIGQNITACQGQFAMTPRVLEGDALAKFNTKASELCN